MPLIASTGGYLGSSSGGTSSAINTTGANFLLVSVAHYSDAGGQVSTSNLSDSKVGNTWNQLTWRGSSGQTAHRFFWCVPASVGSGHTVTISTPFNSYPVIAFYAFDNMAASPFDVENGASTGGSGSGSYSVGSNLTPTYNNEVFFSALACGDGTPGSVTPSLSTPITDSFGGATAYEIQTTATARDPSWSWTGGNQGKVVANAAFKTLADPEIAVSEAIKIADAPSVVRLDLVETVAINEAVKSIDTVVAQLLLYGDIIQSEVVKLADIVTAQYSGTNVTENLRIADSPVLRTLNPLQIIVTDSIAIRETPIARLTEINLEDSLRISEDLIVVTVGDNLATAFVDRVKISDLVSASLVSSGAGNQLLLTTL